jgi:hypothetical protein
MYRVFIEFKNGTSKAEEVADAKKAEALKKEWEAEGPSTFSGFALIPATK